MPVEQGYSSQIGPAPAQAPVLAGPEAFGAGVGAALVQIGGQQHSSAIRAYQAERQQLTQDQTADFYHRLAQAQINIDKATNEAQANAGPGGSGHVEAVRSALDSEHDQLFSGITEQGVERHAREQWDKYSGAVMRQAGDWQYGQQIGKRVLDITGSIGTQAERVRFSGDPAASYTQALGAFHGMVANAGLPPEARQKLEQQGLRDITTARIQNGFDSNPAAELALIRGGAYSGVYSQSELDHLVRAGESELRAKDAQQRHIMATAKADYNTRVELFLGRARAGEDVKAPEVQQLIRDAQTFDEPVKAQEIQKAVEDQGFARQYRTLATNPAQMQQHIAGLAAKKNPSPIEQRELAWAQDHAETFGNKFTGDPVGYLAAFGGRGSQPPAVNVADPHSLIARENWRVTQVAVTGHDMPPLSDAEMGPLRDMIQKGPAGRIDVLSKLDSLPAMARAHWAKAIMPNDKLFQQEAQVVPSARATLQAGREAEQGNSGYWPSKSPNDEKQAASAVQLANFDGMLAYALRGMDPSDVRAAQQNMRNYVAGKASAAGKANVHDLHPGELREAIAYALGGQIKDGKQYGGVAQWSGPQSFVAIPESMTASDFGTAILRDRMAQDRAGKGPVNPNGKPFDLKGAVPVLIGDGLYRWETAAGVVLRKDRQPYISRIGGR